METPSTLEQLFSALVFHNAIVVRHEDNQEYVVAWVSCYNKGESVTSKVMPFLTVMDMEGNLVRNSSTEREVKLAARQFRVQQIRAELGLDGASNPSPKDLDTILERTWDGQWMGQFSHGNQLYASELADLLGLELQDVWPVIDKLREMRKADLAFSSTILVPPDDALYYFDGYELYGHKKLVPSDFGYWSCRACKKSGDDMEDPSDFPCTPVSEK